MPVRTVEPRLPLEPEEYPLYRPPRRLGCSALTIVTLLTLGVFFLLVWRVTPNWASGIVSPIGRLFGSTPQANTTPGAGVLATTTAIKAPPSPTRVPIVVNPTPVFQYVKVANTGGSGVRMRTKPLYRSTYNSVATEGTIMKIIGTDTPEAGIGTWRNVEVASGPQAGQQGWILSRYLASSGPPSP